MVGRSDDIGCHPAYHYRYVMILITYFKVKETFNLNMFINLYWTGDIDVDWKIVMKCIYQNNMVRRGLNLLSSSGEKLAGYSLDNGPETQGTSWLYKELLSSPSRLLSIS